MFRLMITAASKALVATLALSLGLQATSLATARADEREGPTAAMAKTAADKPKLPLSKVNRGALGYWKHIDEDTGKTQSIFKIWMHKGKLVGKIVKAFPKDGKPAQKICSECEGRRHNRPIEGMTFFWGFKPDEDEKRKWVDGKILNPEDGEVYNAEAELSADGKRLEVFGYVRVLIKIGGTSVWQRPTAKELAGL
ncbi:MAG: DUF2147 domain-containing protein [Myxococcales bacterium]|nr:DUF2147 domain-containing protein [Myxococcales bacterium]